MSSPYILLEKPKTLVDKVEDQLLTYLRNQNYQVGDLIPNEMELAADLGVARSVLREALSRLPLFTIAISIKPDRLAHTYILTQHIKNSTYLALSFCYQGIRALLESNQGFCHRSV
mgnify:CR=1 FL=1